MKYMPSIGELLREARKKRKLTLVKVAAYAEVLSKQALSDIECGRRAPPRYDVLLKIGNFLNISCEEMMYAAARYYRSSRERRKERDLPSDG